MVVWISGVVSASSAFTEESAHEESSRSDEGVVSPSDAALSDSVVSAFGAETSILEEGLKNEQLEVNGREKQVMMLKRTYFFTKLPPRFLFIE